MVCIMNALTLDLVAYFVTESYLYIPISAYVYLVVLREASSGRLKYSLLCFVAEDFG